MGTSLGWLRYGIGALGAALAGVGVWLVLGVPHPLDVGVWLVGALVLHDGVVAPLVLGVGLLVAALPARRAVRGALIVAGCLTVVALPVLARPGATANPSVLPLDYLRNWLLLLTAVAACTGVLIAVRCVRRRRRK
ncbi:hypothetical protein [Streptomyces sp. NPDC046985]|uniref:hypothetical protein n=1 Tax=Streptomyces sp. NPDC046985 TaxID=3155377 RepID=UPI0033CE9F52